MDLIFLILFALIGRLNHHLCLQSQGSLFDCGAVLHRETEKVSK